MRPMAVLYCQGRNRYRRRHWPPMFSYSQPCTQALFKFKSKYWYKLIWTALISLLFELLRERKGIHIENSPIINGILIQLSKAKPVKNLQMAKDQNWFELAVAIEAKSAILLEIIKAGIRPLWSAIHPKRKPPMIEPQKKIDCAVDMR